MSSMIERLSEIEETAEAIAEYTVFGRVTPAQKRQFVQALKAQGGKKRCI